MCDMEESFSRYLETCEADKTFNSFFIAVRKAFIAGYNAADDDAKAKPAVLKIVELLELQNNNEEKTVVEK